MREKEDSEDDFDRLHTALDVISKLEEEINDESVTPRLEAARADVANAGSQFGTPGFEQYLQESMGHAASVAISYEYDELAGTAMEAGGDIELSI